MAWHLGRTPSSSLLLLLLLVVAWGRAPGTRLPCSFLRGWGDKTPRRPRSPSSPLPLPALSLPASPAPPRPVPPLSSEETFRRLVHRPVSGPRCRGLEPSGPDGAGAAGPRVCAAAGGAGAGPRRNGALTVSEPGPAGRRAPGGGRDGSGRRPPLPGARPRRRKAPALLLHLALGTAEPDLFGGPHEGRSLPRPTP